MLGVFVVGLVLGVFAILCVEAAGVLFVLRRLNRKIKQESDASASKPQSQPQLSLDFTYNKQVFVFCMSSLCHC